MQAMLNTDPHRLHRSEIREGEQGFLLLGLIVAIFLILLALGVAAPRAAHELRREREVEAVRRGNAYVRAIEVYYLKMGNYPTSISQLEKTNNIRFLRKRYSDPMTGKDDWRVIHLGEAKTTVKGFFGKPLGGIESTSLGGSSAGTGSTSSAFGSSSSSGSGGLTSSFGSSSGSGSGSGSGGLTSSFGSSSSGAGSTGLSSSTSGTSSGSNGIGGGSGIGAEATAGPIVGIGLAKNGNSIMTLNEQTTYETWEFLYDPRIEQLKARVSLFGGGMASTDAANLGSAADSKSSTSSGDFNFGSGSSSNSGGQSTSGSFGSSGFGSGTSSSPSPTTNTPQ
jgi:type II secretory pathway pseudopilin PulG